MLSHICVLSSSAWQKRPACDGKERKHLHVPGQFPFPWHLHAPFAQTFERHAFPHAPQLAPLVARSTHDPLQQVSAPQSPQHSVLGMQRLAHFLVSPLHFFFLRFFLASPVSAAVNRPPKPIAPRTPIAPRRLPRAPSRWTRESKRSPSIVCSIVARSRSNPGSARTYGDAIPRRSDAGHPDCWPLTSFQRCGHS